MTATRREQVIGSAAQNSEIHNIQLLQNPRRKVRHQRLCLANLLSDKTLATRLVWRLKKLFERHGEIFYLKTKKITTVSVTVSTECKKKKKTNKTSADFVKDLCHRDVCSS